jgi:hypothetical protein
MISTHPLGTDRLRANYKTLQELEAKKDSEPKPIFRATLEAASAA